MKLLTIGWTIVLLLLSAPVFAMESIDTKAVPAKVRELTQTLGGQAHGEFFVDKSKQTTRYITSTELGGATALHYDAEKGEVTRVSVSSYGAAIDPKHAVNAVNAGLGHFSGVQKNGNIVFDFGVYDPKKELVYVKRFPNPLELAPVKPGIPIAVLVAARDRAAGDASTYLQSVKAPPRWVPWRWGKPAMAHHLFHPAKDRYYFGGVVSTTGKGVRTTVSAVRVHPR